MPSTKSPRYGDESRISTFMGVIQALIAFFTDTNDTLKSIHVGQHKFVFLLRDPIYLVAVAQTEEPEVQLRYQLVYLYDQILSIVSYSQIQKIFKSHSNFDLRKLITGTESMIDHLADNLMTNFCFALGSVECIRIPPMLRERLGLALKLAKSKNVLYALLISGMKLVTLLRAKNVALYSSDLHILFSTVTSFSSFKMGENWIPICLPKFNQNGFLHVYICYLTPNLCLLLLSSDKSRFSEMSDIKSNIVEKLTKNGDLEKVEEILNEPTYSPAEISIPGLRHFFYRSNKMVQHTSSLFGEPYVKLHEQQSLLEKYHGLWAQLHDRQQASRIVHRVSESESMLGWCTSTFELYATFGPLIRKNTLVNSSNLLIKWVKRNEEALFATHPPIV
ncbi:MON1-like protein A-like protein [Dimargaris cristalligena]|uniref:Vacuolar fusion protein MON1 n=1 Tax=Dimargaris cristalligena TaxID=215637 RepID=A0A4P9ZZJ8_9FUNG|nr:MON1-like protein A-like protein [Dimargaris cristalligena]|eukprot:RKP39137.1 MON1-like protein A-like protein [Dimargaris cristalligena]